jgi:hypothetical protein
VQMAVGNYASAKKLLNAGLNKLSSTETKAKLVRLLAPLR